MNINLENADNHSIQAYSEEEIKIDSQLYKNSLILSVHELISDWPITAIKQLNEQTLEPLLRHVPKVILIGHDEPGQFAPLSIMQDLAKRRIGLEVMSIAAACRTFNVLLNEHREVVLGIIKKTKV
ncbi:MAG: hypothetical protein H0U70_03840 [Tatlockia sp.]|nr:hypothetical protein [Tatlockia sp.]